MSLLNLELTIFFYSSCRFSSGVWNFELVLLKADMSMFLVCLQTKSPSDPPYSKIELPPVLLMEVIAGDNISPDVEAIIFSVWTSHMPDINFY